ncbi:MAG TPA: serine/threonine-protein kinase [Pseudonocardiaceae bacterium]|nr:serine/threonine-protein kinase [Pseudonocardiaceae bacterium]
MTGVGDLIAERYRVVAQVGSGSMGVVWRATDELLHRDVAVKELLLQPGITEEQADEAKRRAMREGRITARLQHQNAITVYDVAEHDGRPCLVMQYVPSQSLADRLIERRALPPADVATIGREVAGALAAAHAAGIVHRDVKPGNVLLAEDGTAMLTDFGISRAVGDGTVTATGVLAGTPAYLAPEVVQGQDADFRSDVFSLGATLYAAVEGTPPFGLSDNPIALLHKIATENIAPPKQSGDLTKALTWMLRRDPADRPTMGQTVAALSIAGGEFVLPPRPSPKSGRTGDKRSRALRSGIIALIVIAAAILLTTLPHRGGPRTGAGTGATTSTRSVPSTTASRPTTTTPAATTTATAAASRSSQLAATIEDYYRLVPGHLDTAWTWLTADYQRNHAGGRSGYQSFWSAVNSVSVTDVTAQPPDKVTATISYHYADHTDVERTSFGLVRQAGQWKIASSDVLSHHQE